MPYTSTSTVPDIAAAIRGARRILVTTHAKPDGDALGSVLAIVRACAVLGIAAEGWIVGPFEESLISLAGPTPITWVDPKAPKLPGDDYDLVVIVDTGAWTQLETLAAWLRPRVPIAIGIDHHARGDDVAARRIVDVSCGSCTALLVHVIDALGVPLTTGADARGRGSVAEALYLGLATDTGWFRFQNARAPEFAFAARLLGAGVDKDYLLERIEQSHRESRLRIEAKALSSVQFIDLGAAGPKGVAAIMRLSASDFAATGATLEETSGVVNLPMVIGRVRASVLLLESDPGLVKVSFRSKPKDDDGRYVDVNEVAATFGGGGHVHAAGAKIKGTLDDAETKVKAALAARAG
jgi:phosphoesterase RecJ-like protein